MDPISSSYGTKGRGGKKSCEQGCQFVHLGPQEEDETRRPPAPGSPRDLRSAPPDRQTGPSKPRHFLSIEVSLAPRPSHRSPRVMPTLGRTHEQLRGPQADARSLGVTACGPGGTQPGHAHVRARATRRGTAHSLGTSYWRTAQYVNHLGPRDKTLALQTTWFLNIFYLDKGLPFHALKSYTIL